MIVTIGKQKKRKWFTKEVERIEEIFSNLFEKANIKAEINNNFYDNSIAICIQTGLNPHLISMATQSFSHGRKKWEIYLNYCGGLLYTIAKLKIEKDLNNGRDLATEIQYKRGLLKLKFESFFNRVFPTF